jgi:hypothetical protein
MLQGSQYDTYGYLFTAPTFISLNPNAAPNSIVISGMRIGVNGSIPTVGQAYATLNATVGPPNYTAAAGQLLSSVGTVIGADKGVDSDMFFLSFDQFGSSTHAYVEPTFTATAIPPDNTLRPDMGVRTFAQINATMSAITGVPITDSVVSTLYNTEQQSLPAAPQINAFLSSHQTAISQLAAAYCGQLVDTAALRDAFFGTGLDASLSATAGTFFGSSAGATTAAQDANRSLVITPLVAKAAGTNVYPASGPWATSELNTLILRIPGLNGSATVSTATKAACTAMLGSAAVSLQ